MKGAGKDNSECARRKCTYYKNQMCTDSKNYVTTGTNDLVCRYHKDAVLKGD